MRCIISEGGVSEFNEGLDPILYVHCITAISLYLQLSTVVASAARLLDGRFHANVISALRTKNKKNSGKYSITNFSVILLRHHPKILSFIFSSVTYTNIVFFSNTMLDLILLTFPSIFTVFPLISARALIVSYFFFKFFLKMQESINFIVV